MDYRPLQKLTTAGLVIGGFLALAAIGMLVFGYGTVQNNLGSGFAVSLNGHPVSAPSQKLRPGSYDLQIVSTHYATVRRTIKVSSFGTTKLAKPTTVRDPSQIVRSVIAASGLYGPPDMSRAQWLLNDTWLIGNVGPGDAIPIALQHANGRWQVKYYDTSGYPRSQAALPGVVVTALEGIKPSAQ